MPDVLEGVFKKMKGTLTLKDLEKLSSGTSVRWANKAQWERQRLKTEGYLKKDSPHGIWEITEQGRKLCQGLREKG
jgi:restriction endonuclease Mrr